MALTVSQIAAVSYNAVLNTLRKPDNQWAESSAMRALDAGGFIKSIPGGPQIEAVLDYRRNPNAGFQALDLDPVGMGKTDVISAAVYDPAQLSVPVVWSKADEAKNPSDNQKVAFTKALLQNALDSHDDLFEQAVFGVTASGFLGLQSQVPDSGQGTVGGINSATETWWRHYSGTYLAAGTDIIAKTTLAWNTATRGTGGGIQPSLMLSDAETQATYEGAATTYVRYNDTQNLKAGFTTLVVKTAKWVFSPWANTRIYFLAPKAIQLVTYQGAFRDKGDTQELESGQGFVFKLFSMAQLVVRNKVRLALLTEV